MTTRQAARGFTLVEVLVALSLLALLTAFLAGGLREASRRFRLWESRTPAELGIATVHGFLRGLLESAYPAVREADGPRLVSFDGQPDGVTFTTMMPPDVLPGGFYRVALSRREDRLVLLWTPERHDAAPMTDRPGVGRHELLREVTELRLQYFGAARRDEPPRWRAEWHGMTRIPQLIRVDLGFDPARGVSWPPLIVATHVEDDVGCIYDPSLHDCLGR